MKVGRRFTLAALPLLLSAVALTAASFSVHAQPKPAAPTTLSFNWEGAYGRGNILVWPFRPGGRYEQLVTQYTNGTVKLDIKEKLFSIMDSAFAVGDGRVLMGTQSIAAASGTYPLLDFGGIPGLFSEIPNGATEYANALLDPRARGAGLAAAEALALADYPVIPVFHSVNLRLVSDRVSGWIDNSRGANLSRFLGLNP